MSTKSPQSNTYRWDLMFPFSSFEILLKKVKVPILLGMVLISIAGIIVGSARAVSWVRSVIPQVKATIPAWVDEVYPKDLVIKATNGVISTNAREPIYIPYPKQLIDWTKSETRRENYFPPNFIV